MIQKKFDQKLHDRFDPPARKLVSEWIDMKWGCKVESGSTYGVDLVIKRDDKPVAYAEVEVRQWGMRFCPFPTIHVASRKKKLLQNELPTLFFAVADDMEHGYWCKSADIVRAPLIEVGNKYVNGGEYFYDVPVEFFKYVRLTDKF
jgi:hypothetical protein